VTLRSGGFAREVSVHVPPAIAAGKPLPLVLGLHGAGGSGDHFLTDDGWDAMADAKGFIVAAPDGLPARPRMPADFVTNPRLWNSGQLSPASPRATIDDVAFVEELIDFLERRLPVDDRRVYVTGHSNGGGMTFRLAAGLSNRVTAIATVAGQVAIEHPRVARPMPTLYIIGAKDPLMPENGGDAPTTWGARQTLPVPEYLGRWAAALGCSRTAESLSDRDGVRTSVYRAATSGGASLTVVRIEGHGHAWPGARVNRLGEKVLGPIANKLDATDAIWRFFAAAPPLEAKTR
jgi:polyhydroxybutyrate depolymerase